MVGMVLAVGADKVSWDFSVVRLNFQVTGQRSILTAESDHETFCIFF